MTPVLAPIPPKLEKLVPRLTSASDVQILSTVRTIDWTLRAAGLEWHVLTVALASSSSSVSTPIPKPQPAPGPQRPPTWLETADTCSGSWTAGILGSRGMIFVLEMVRLLRRGETPSGSHGARLLEIHAKLEKARRASRKEPEFG